MLKYYDQGKFIEKKKERRTIGRIGYILAQIFIIEIMFTIIPKTFNHLPINILSS